MMKLFWPLMAVLSSLTWADLDLQQVLYNFSSSGMLKEFFFLIFIMQFCADKGLNEVAVHPQDCRGYISCSETPVVQYCEEGLHFDMNGLVCNWPEKVNCEISSRQIKDGSDFVKPTLTALAAYDIMTGHVVNPLLHYNPLNVVCRHFGAYFLPNPQKCRSYYLCAYGHMHEHICGAHTLWDYQRQQCVLSHQANCYQSTSDEEKELNLAVDNVMMVCYPAKANKSLTEMDQFPSTDYVTAVTPTTTIATTLEIFPTQIPTGLPPTLDVLTTISTTSTKPLFPNPYNIKCPAKQQRYVAHPEDCGKYFMCIMGIPVMTFCPKGLLWDSNKSYCEIAENVKCFAEKVRNNKNEVKIDVL